MKSLARNLLVLFALSAITALIMWGFVSGHSEDADDATVQAPPRTAQINGETVLKFDLRAQRTNGIVVTALKPARQSATESATATVLDLQPLLDLESKYITAQEAIAQAQTAATASESEYKRVLGLNRDGENVSQKSIEAACAVSKNDATALDSARQNLTTLEQSTELHWGSTVAAWIRNGSPQLEALFAQREYLVQVTATNPTGWSAPAEVIIHLPNETNVVARRITALPEIDPRLQAPEYLYSVPAMVGIVPGLNLTVSLPAGPLQWGVVIPQSAIIWSQGQAWVYVETAPGQFTRIRTSTSNPTVGGWFVSSGMVVESRVVTQGAQTLFAEEFRSEIQSQED